MHHSTPIHPSITKSPWDSSSPDTTITCINQQQPAKPEVDALLANQDQNQDHQDRITRHHRRDDVVPPGGSIDRVWRGKCTTGHKIDWPVGGLVGYHRRSTHGRGCFADLGSGTLVPRGMDWRSCGGLPGIFRVCGYSVIMQTLADSTERGSTGGSATTNGQKAARCQWLVDRDLGMLV